MPRTNRHGWKHEPQPEYIIRTAAVIVIAVVIIVAAFLLFGH